MTPEKKTAVKSPAKKAPKKPTPLKVATTVAEAEVVEQSALSTFGPGGIVLARSYDGGQSWKATKEGTAYLEAQKVPPPRQFTRRIAAVADIFTPAFARRIETTWEIFYEAGIVGGWAPFDNLAALPEEAMDGIVCPGLYRPEQLEQLRKATKALILDLDAPAVWSDEARELLMETLSLYDGVIVPSNLLASKIRPYHDRVFVTSHLLRGKVWRGTTRPLRRDKVTVAYPTTIDETLQTVIDTLANNYGDRVEWVPFDWYRLSPIEEPSRYVDFDVVLVPACHDRNQVSAAPILPAFAAQCTVVADVHWPLVRHRTTGLQIGKNTVDAWRSEIKSAINDSRLRIRLGRAAYHTATRYTPQVRMNEVLLPYRLLVPEGAPFQYAPE